jgi:hypothetical protein
MYQINGPLAALGTSDQDAGPVTGNITRVTLYRGQALVTREIEISGAKGSHEVVISNLPGTILDGSLFADSTQKIEVRAVRFQQRAVGEEPREEVREIDQQIGEIQKAINLNAKQTELAAQKLAYLDQLQGFVAPTASAELSKGVLNADTLKQLTEYSFEQRGLIAEQQVKLAKEQVELQQTLELLNRQKAELSSTAQRTVNEAKVFVEKLDAEKSKIELNYLVGSCGWTPTYTIKAEQGREQVALEFSALIGQMTGEDWSNVQLTLSTASPSLSASGPSLAPFAVTLVGGIADGQQQSMPQAVSALNYLDAEKTKLAWSSNRAKQMEAGQQVGQSIDFQSRISGNWSVNLFACQTQSFELVTPFEVLSSITAESDSTDPPSISYRLDNLVSLISRTDQQMVRILNGKLPGNFYHVATPLLSSYVYREAEISNTSNQDLLGGAVTAYLDGRFVGRAEIPTVAQGESFVLGFGSDAQLRARRELVDKKSGVRGGNNELRLAYRIEVENYKAQAIKLRIFDRLPYSEKTSEMRITLGKLASELSTDPVYLRRERPKNILRWDVEVPAQATGEQNFLIEYDFTLDHDRNYMIADATSEKGAEDFLRLERSRQKR